MGTVGVYEQLGHVRDAKPGDYVQVYEFGIAGGSYLIHEDQDIPGKVRAYSAFGEVVHLSPDTQCAWL